MSNLNTQKIEIKTKQLKSKGKTRNVSISIIKEITDAPTFKFTMCLQEKSPKQERCKDQINGGRGERQNMIQDRDEKRKSNIVMQTCNKHLEVSYSKISAKQWGLGYLIKYLFLSLLSLHAQ